jgi:coproporphyrinogen III oxidase
VAQYQEFLEQENQQIAANIEEMEDQLDNQEGQWAMEEEEMLRELRGMGYEEEDTLEAQK